MRTPRRPDTWAPSNKAIDIPSPIPSSLTIHSPTHAHPKPQSNHLWLILEYCVGGDLSTLLKQDKLLPQDSVHDFGRELAEALQVLHAHSVVYCDLKPSNILLNEDGKLKLCDFGLAKRLSDVERVRLKSSAPAAQHGTPCYMAPEVRSVGG